MLGGSTSTPKGGFGTSTASSNAGGDNNLIDNLMSVFSSTP